MLRRTSLACMAALALAGQASAANLLTNPGFEAGSTGWNFWSNGGTIAVGEADLESAEAARTGSVGGRVTVTKADAANNWHLQLQIPVSWTAQAGKTYQLTFWARSQASAALTLGVNRGGKYATSFGFSTSPAWKPFEFFYKTDTSGRGVVAFNVFLAGATGVFDFDDFAIDTVPSSLPATMPQPKQGAWTTGEYRNLFAELGYSREAVNTKVNNAFQQIFFGDSATERLYHVVPSDTTMGFIDNADGSVLTEGQSYGMMISLQMNRQDVFDKLWKFVKNQMQQKSGPLQGYISWKISNKAPYTAVDVNPAPDGEEYFVTALLMAGKRWGSKTGIYNYQEQADSMLTYMLKSRTGMGPQIDPVAKQIVFSPAQPDPYTDPSYHLPGFYRLWAALASHDNALFTEMASASWAFLKHAEHPTTGLFPEYASFDGVPEQTTFNAKSHIFASDAQRVAANIGFSWAWFMDDPWALDHTKKQLGFFASQTGGYKAEYSLDGTPQVDYLSESLVAMNAVAALASDRASDWAFVDALWKQPTPSGQWRYYNGLLHMLGMLHASGNFKAWGSPGLTSSIADRTSLKGSALRITTTGRSLRIEGAGAEPIRLLDVRGAEIARSLSAELRAPAAGMWIVDAGRAGRQLVAIP